MASASSSSTLNPSVVFATLAASLVSVPETLDAVQRKLSGNARTQDFYDCANVLHPKNPLKQFRNGIFRHAEKIDLISTIVWRWGIRTSVVASGPALGMRYLKDSSLIEGNDLIRNKLDVTSRWLGIGGACIFGGTFATYMGWFVAKVAAGVYAPIFMYRQDETFHSSVGRYERCRELEAEQNALKVKERELQPSWARPENLRTPITAPDRWHTPRWVAGLGAFLGGIIIFAATRGMPLRAPVTPGFMGGTSSSRENFGYSGT